MGVLFYRVGSWLEFWLEAVQVYWSSYIDLFEAFGFIPLLAIRVYRFRSGEGDFWKVSGVY